MTIRYERYLKPREAAEILRVSEKTLAKWRWNGGGPVFCRIGRKILYRDDDLSAFVTRHRSTSDDGTAVHAMEACHE